MRFSRSKLQASREWSPSRSLSTLKDCAENVPHNLKNKIIYGGYHPLMAWLASEEGDVWNDRFEAKLGLSADEYQRHFLDADGAFGRLNPQNILMYCETIGVHPAHLMPFDNDPRLSLPANLLLANALILKDRNYTAEDKGLAQRAIQTEKERFARFVQSREVEGYLANDKGFEKLQVFRLVDQFMISQAGGFVEIVPQLPEKSPISKDEMCVVEGSRNALTMLFEKEIVARDRKNQERRRELMEENENLRVEERRVQDAYFRLFDRVVPDIGTAAANFAKAITQRVTLLEPNDATIKSESLTKVRGFLMTCERESFSRLHQATRAGESDATEQEIELRVDALVKASADMIYASKSRLVAFRSYTIDKKSHAGDVEKFQSTQNLIESGELSYISRLVANQHMICWMDRSYRPHEAMQCLL